MCVRVWLNARHVLDVMNQRQTTMSSALPCSSCLLRMRREGDVAVRMAPTSALPNPVSSCVDSQICLLRVHLQCHLLEYMLELVSFSLLIKLIEDPPGHHAVVAICCHGTPGCWRMFGLLAFPLIQDK